MIAQGRRAMGDWAWCLRPRQWRTSCDPVDLFVVGRCITTHEYAVQLRTCYQQVLAHFQSMPVDEDVWVGAAEGALRAKRTAQVAHEKCTRRRQLGEEAEASVGRARVTSGRPEPASCGGAFHGLTRSASGRSRAEAELQLCAYIGLAMMDAATAQPLHLVPKNAGGRAQRGRWGYTHDGWHASPNRGSLRLFLYLPATPPGKPAPTR